MKLSTGLFFWALLTLVLAALSLGPSFAHVLEAAPRLNTWSPELWRETTVFNRQFLYFAVVGAPLDIGIILVSAIFAWLLRSDRSGFLLALAGTFCYLASLAAWFSLVKPANDVLATWTPGPIAENFEALRLRWETGHMVVAAIKLAGLALLVSAALMMRRVPAPR